MKAIKLTLIAVGSLVAILMIISFFLAKEVQFSRSIMVNASPKTIYNEVVDLKNWPYWGRWFKLDPQMKLEFFGSSTGAGSGYKWSGNEKVEYGEMKITEAQQNTFIKTELMFTEMGVTKGIISFEENGDSTLVMWEVSMNVESPLFLGPWFGLFMEDMMSLDIDTSLTNLKQHTESLLKKPKIRLAQSNIEKKWLMSIRDTIEQSDMAGIHESMFTEIKRYMKMRRVKAIGPSLAIYHFWGDKIAVQCGIPVPDSLRPYRNVTIGMRSLPKALVTRHQGPYKDLPKTHRDIDQYLEYEEIKQAGPRWEVYIADADSVEDSLMFVTDIYIPID
ncbi:MAG: SRPBCC family protein [Bacteroidetes bacterium]|nr:SRPBCC family protein [Bacteroidota bacterium]